MAHKRAHGKMTRHFAMPENIPLLNYMKNGAPSPLDQPGKEKLVREEKKGKTHPPRKWRGKPAYNTPQGAPCGFPPALRGFAQMGFRGVAAVQAGIRAARTSQGYVRLLSSRLHCTLRAQTPGGVCPHSVCVLVFRVASKTHFALRARYMQFGLAHLSQ